MSKKVDNIFAYSRAQDFEFTDSERLVAYVFSHLNLQSIKNELSNWATRKALLSFDPDVPEPEKRFIMESEYLRGGIEFAAYLIAQHESTEEALEQQMRAASEINAEDERDEREKNPDLLNPNL